MAASATILQSYLISRPMATAGAHSGFKRSPYSSAGLPLASLRCSRAMRVRVRVRCQAEEKKPTDAQPAPTTPIAPPQPIPTPPPKAPKASTKFSDILAFSGPAPERINGRLAMIGFVAAIGAELASGNDLAAQLANGGLPWFLWTAALFSAASLVPLFQGVTTESKSSGLMTADAEMWNGRFAMLGLVALAFTEYVKGGPLV